MSFAFAGLDVATLGGQLDMVERFCVVLANLADTKKLESGARLIREETQRHLQAMADATKAEQSLAQAKAAHDQRAAELQAKAQDLASREQRLHQLAAQVAQREEALANAKRELREKLKAA
jgi:hypothetical protein